LALIAGIDQRWGYRYWI